MKGFVVTFTFFMCSFISMGMFQVVPSSKCIMQGEFPIYDGTCQNYYMCIFNGVEFVTYSLKCAGSTLFDPSLRYCTSDYVCMQTTPITTLSTSSISTSSSSSSISTPLTSISTPPSSSSISTPLTSISTPPVSISTAPSTSISTPLTSISTPPSSSSISTPLTSISTPPVSISTAPSTSISTPSTSTSIPTSTPTSTTAAPCNGRYPLNDPKCQQYYFCYTMGGTTVRYNLTCPTILRFNPHTQRCVLPALYPCISV